MAEPKKKVKFEAETSLQVKIKPAQKAARMTVQREGEPISGETSDAAAYAGDEDRKQVILRIIDYFKTN
jgi:hypothetical protein